MMDLPPTFVPNIKVSFGEDGANWLSRLPLLVEEATQRWDLATVQPVSNLSYNYVAFAKRSNEDVVLKIGVPNLEFISEMTALRIFDGDGAVKLLEADADNYMFLMERVRPGMMLAELVDDDERCTHIACDVMTHLWRHKPQGSLIQLSEWFDGLKGLRVRFEGGTGPFPEKLVARVESLIPELFAASNPPVLLHGDFHHFNVLSSERGWLVIDPKGVIGPPEYEVGPLLINPWDDFLKLPDAVRITERRIAILSERLGFPRERLRDWGLCHAVLSAWWDLTEDGTGGEYSIGCAEVIAKASV
jgi:streptomycin 6-kinase